MVRIVPRAGGTFEYLRAEIDYAGVVGRYTQLKPERCGAVLVGLCPLKEQQSGNPAFKIYPGGWGHCFSCGFHGDVTKFWQVKHGIATPLEAAHDLAREFGLALPETDPATQARYEEQRRKEEESAETVKANHARLLHSDKGRAAREYLEGRGFGPDLQERFHLGVKPDGNISIPYWSAGRVHGVVTRKVDGSTPKYLYPRSEDLPLGRKPLFATEYPRAGEYVLVEGVLDQLALRAMGVPSIGVGGSSPSKEQLENLLDLGNKGCTFVVLPDNDETGRAKARETVERLYPYARLASPLQEGKDAADLFAAEGTEGRGAIEALADDAPDALDLALADVPDRAREKIRHLKERVHPLVTRLPASEQQAVIKDVARRLGLSQENVRQALAEHQAAANPISKANEDDEAEIPEEEWAHLLKPGVLDRYVRDATGARGVVGEADKEVVKVITLVAIGAQLAPLPNGKPIGGSIMLTGPAGRGKNYLSDAAVELLPEQWYLSFEAASATVFYYAVELDPAFLKHKFIYPNEAEAVDAVVEFLRPMLSQGRAKKFVTNKNGEGQNAFQELRVEGPITGCIPTVRNKLDDQLQTRMLVTELEEYEGRIQAHTKALSSLFAPDWSAAFDTGLAPKWRAALHSLAEVRKVVIGFAAHPEFKLSNEEISHGARLWQNLLGLVCAHAWLEQRNREVRDLSDGSRAVVATAADYEAAFGIFKATSRRSVVNLSDTHRKIVQAVYDLSLTTRFPSEGFSGQKIADEAGISKSTVSKNRAYLTMSVGLLYETEDKKLAISEDADPSWWAEGNPMEGFPTPSEVHGWEKTPHPLRTPETVETRKR